MIDQETVSSIENLHRLKEQGIITGEEFDKSKERLLFGAKATRPNAKGGAATAIAMPEEQDIVGWAILPLRRYADFAGRSSRREYWLFQLLPATLLLVMLMAAGSAFDDGSVMGGLTFLMSGLGLLGLAVPQIAVQVRRFHDMDRTGLLALINLVPYAGAIVVLVLMLLEGTPGPNRYGPEPKAS